jgi:hypothetical protein
MNTTLQEKAVDAVLADTDQPETPELSAVEKAYPHVQWMKGPDGVEVPLTRANRRAYLKAVGALRGGTRRWRVKAFRG